MSWNTHLMDAVGVNPAMCLMTASYATSCAPVTGVPVWSRKYQEKVSLHPGQMKNANLAHPSESPDAPQLLSTAGICRKVFLHAIGREFAIGRQVNSEGCG